MQQSSLKVLIIGAGTGGLCLAQGLKQNGIAFEVFERDRTPSDRLQGYRLSINPDGRRALKACLPRPLFDELLGVAGVPSQRLTFLDHGLHRLLSIDVTGSRRPEEQELPVSRVSLRRVLLEGLDAFVRFDKRFVAFDESPSGRVTARFEDGTEVTGDVLVGADGASSRVRAQLLPTAERVETGILAVSGKFPLDDAARAFVPDAVTRGPTLILGPHGCFLFSNAVQYDDRREGDEYVMWGFSAARETFPLPADLESVDATKLKVAVLSLMDDWNPAVRSMIAAADAPTVIAFPVRTSVPVPPWKTRRVTLLGDALHNMTPYRGIGANTALRDAAALRSVLDGAHRGDEDLLRGLARFEKDMIDYGFRAVRASLKNMRRFHARGRLARVATLTELRIIDHVPPLKAKFVA